MPALLAAAGVVAVLVTGAFLLLSDRESADRSVVSPSVSPIAEPTAESPSPAEPTGVWESTSPSFPSVTSAGSVVTAPNVTDGRATAVTATLRTYFDGINSRDYAAAASVFDPSGPVDVSDPEEMRRFAEGLATTTDSEVVLQDITQNVDGTLRALVTFQSQQDSGYGPRGREAETCTRWTITYHMRDTASGYLVVRTKGSSTPC